MQYVRSWFLSERSARPRRALPGQSYRVDVPFLIEGARVELRDQGSSEDGSRIETTDVFGFFAFEELDESDYELVVMHPGYESDQTSVDLTGEDEATIRRKLRPVAETIFDISVQAVGVTSQAPLNGADVRIQRWDNAAASGKAEVRQFKAHGQGYGMTRGLRPGYFRFRVDHADWQEEVYPSDEGAVFLGTGHAAVVSLKPRARPLKLLV